MVSAYLAVVGVNLTQERMTMLKVVTFNIRCDFNQDGNQSFSYRKDLIFKKIEKENPDILCFQEVLPHVAVWLKENLSSYYVLGCGRSENLRDEQMAIAYKKDKYNLISMETYWLSKTPHLPGSRYKEQSICPRTCTEVLLEDLEENKVFRIINTHLDHEGSHARRLGLQQIINKVEENTFFKEVPTFLMGDFNAEPSSDELSILRNDGRYVNLTKDVGITYHGFLPEDEAEYIDYIYLKDNEKILNLLSIEKWQDKVSDIWLSDHYPICAILKWKKEEGGNVNETI